MGRKGIIAIFISVILILVIGIFFWANHKEVKDSQDEYTENNYNSHMELINKEKLESILNSNEDGWIYISRPTCPDCQEFYPILSKELNAENKNIFYFDTTCKASEKKEMRELLRSLNIEEIPAIIEIKNGNKKILDMQNDDDIKNFKNNF